MWEGGDTLGIIGCSDLSRVSPSAHNISPAEVNHVGLFIAQTGTKVCAIIRNPCNEFDGNRLLTERQSPGEMEGEKRKFF